jgi:protein disulfide-isomerase
MKIVYALLSCLLLTIGLEAAPLKLNWMTSYEDALNQAKAEKKPVLLFFTGSDWCGWCHKLENEVLDTMEFSDSASGKFIFVVVDFPMKKALDAKLTAQNKELQKKFDVKGFPTIILIDDQQNQIGVTGYRPGGAKGYFDHLMKMVNDYKGYQKKLSALNQNKELSDAELHSLYGKAKELCRTEDVCKIVATGMNGNDKRFFLLERFRFLADEGQIHDKEAQKIRQELLALDPNNKEKTQYEVAIIEFEAYTEEMDKEKYSPELAIAPLTAYIERFGEDDPENLWRMNMIISQVYLAKNKYQEALKHAQAAHAQAPGDVQRDIQSYIQNIQAQILKL